MNEEYNTKRKSILTRVIKGLFKTILSKILMMLLTLIMDNLFISVPLILVTVILGFFVLFYKSLPTNIQASSQNSNLSLTSAELNGIMPNDAYRYINVPDSFIVNYILNYNKGALLGQNDDFANAVKEAGAKYDLNPLVLVALAQNEVGFAKPDLYEAEKAAQNPFDVICGGSQGPGNYATTSCSLQETTDIAARTIVTRAQGRPATMDYFAWINSPSNTNGYGMYAVNSNGTENTEWVTQMDEIYRQIITDYVQEYGGPKQINSTLPLPGSSNGSVVNISNPIAQQIVSNAYAAIGIPYLYGGDTSVAMDCSAFTQYIFSLSGIKLPRTSEEQYNMGTPVDSMSDLLPGDLVFFSVKGDKDPPPNHVGIFIKHDSSGYIMIDEEVNHGSTTAVINDSYWGPYYYGARRIIKW